MHLGRDDTREGLFCRNFHFGLNRQNHLIDWKTYSIRFGINQCPHGLSNHRINGQQKIIQLPPILSKGQRSPNRLYKKIVSLQSEKKIDCRVSLGSPLSQGFQAD